MSRLVGINHVALEVGSIDEALAFWERLVGPLELRGRSKSMAFVDMGDQFLALREIQFTKTTEVLVAMGHDGLEKSESALAELRAKGIGAR